VKHQRTPEEIAYHRRSERWQAVRDAIFLILVLLVILLFIGGCIYGCGAWIRRVIH
jgi:hypothetical protein